MKTLLPVLVLASAVIAATPAFAADFSSDFVNSKITQRWALDTLEITQRIDVKKRREMEQKSSNTSQTKLQDFEAALNKLMQGGNTAEIDEATMTGMMNNFMQPGQDTQIISIEGAKDTLPGDQNDLMLTDIVDVSDYETTMMIEESFALKADGSVVYPHTEADQEAGAKKAEDETDNAAKWSFDAEKQQLMLTEQQDRLSIAASYKLVELTDKRLVLEDKQSNGSTRMIFSSQ